MIWSFKNWISNILMKSLQGVITFPKIQLLSLLILLHLIVMGVIIYTKQQSQKNIMLVFIVFVSTINYAYVMQVQGFSLIYPFIFCCSKYIPYVDNYYLQNYVTADNRVYVRWIEIQHGLRIRWFNMFS